MTGEAVTGEAVTGEAVTGEAVTGEAVTGEAVTGEAWQGGWQILDHGAFQRGALVLIGLGAAVGALAEVVPLPRPGELLLALAGGAALASVLAGRRNRGGRALLATLGVLPGLALAALTWRALGENTAAGALAGLVGALGLLPGHLGPTARDPLGERLAAAGRFPADAAEEGALVRRAAAAHARTRAGLTGDGSAAAVELRAAAGDLTLQVVDLAQRCRELRAELHSVDLVELEARGSALARAAEATADPAARDDFARAGRATAELQDRLRALRAAHDRLRARLSLQVAILESTAVALSSRRASSIAQIAASLGPLADRVREAGVDLEAEALATAEAT